MTVKSTFTLTATGVGLEIEFCTVWRCERAVIVATFWEHSGNIPFCLNNYALKTVGFEVGKGDPILHGSSRRFPFGRLPPPLYVNPSLAGDRFERRSPTSKSIASTLRAFESADEEATDS